MPKVKIDHLTETFGKKAKPALEMIRANKSKTEILEKTGATVGAYDINFEVEESEIFVIMRLSGSGKSTLIRLLNRLIEPASGNIYIDGQDISSLDKEGLREVRRSRTSMVFQNFDLFPRRTTLENTEYGLEIRGVPKEERQAKAEKASENSSLIAFKDQLPSQLPGRMQQRVGLARALANDPEILLMDEAFSVLGPLIRREIQNKLLDLQENIRKTIIFITHDLNETLRVGNRIALMKDGQIMQIGTGEEILTNPANEYVRTFVEDVNRSEVLTAQNIMVSALTTNTEVDGPTVALKRIRQEEVSMLLAVDKKRQLKGVVRAEKALEACKSGTSLVECVDLEIQTIDKDMLVNDIFPLICDAQTPLTVTDNGKLLGVVIRGNVLEALAETEVNEHK